MPVVLGLIAVATLVPIVRATLAPTAHAAQDLPVYATVHVHAGLVLIVLATWDLPVIVLLEPTVSAREVLNAVVVLIQVALVMVRVSAIRVPTVFVDWAPTAHVRLVPHARAAPVRHAHLFSPLNLLMLQPIVFVLDILLQVATVAVSLYFVIHYKAFDGLSYSET